VGSLRLMGVPQADRLPDGGVQRAGGPAVEVGVAETDTRIQGPNRLVRLVVAPAPCVGCRRPGGLVRR
jgi:hypothetical protein